MQYFLVFIFICLLSNVMFCFAIPKFESFMLYTPHQVNWVIKSRRPTWAGHVALSGSGEVNTGFWWGNLREETTWKTQAQMNDIKMNLRDAGFGGWGKRRRLDRSGSGYGQVAASCKYGDKPSGSIKCGDFLEYLRTF